VYDMFNSMNSSAKQINNMKDFKTFLDNSEKIAEYSTALSYSYDVAMPIYTETPSGEIIKVDFMELYANAFGMGSNSMTNSMMGSSMADAQMSMMGLNVMEEMLPNEDGKGVNDLIKNQYEVVEGKWPENYDEAVVILTKNNEIPDFILYAMGLKAPEEFNENIKNIMSEKSIDDYGQTEWDLNVLLDKKFKMILPCEYYQRTEGQNGCTDLTATETGLNFIFNADDVGTEVKIVGFIRPNEDTKTAMIGSYIGYTAELTQYAINKTNDSELVKAQIDDKENDLITGTKFMTDDYIEPSIEEKSADAKEFIKNSNDDKKAEIYRFIMSQPDPAQVEIQINEMLKDFDRNTFIEQVKTNYSEELGISAEQIDSYVSSMSDDDIKTFAEEAMKVQIAEQYAEEAQKQLASKTNAELAKALNSAKITDDMYALVFDEFTPQKISDSTYEDNLKLLGKADLSDPSSIRIFAKTFEDKDSISDIIADYNEGKKDSDVIHYTDFVALLMSSITSIISGISYLLIAFVGISLVVSSIMIGIITYISVLERTREIGILRAIGASKHDVSTVFNAETLLVGLTAGLIGIGCTCLLNIPINIIIHSLTSLDTLYSSLPVVGAVILVCISMFLTFIAGLIPSRVASKKDPVEALRTE
ncbi:MAG: ABC transporter permease, partial [Ruminococcus sp.]|nr:ABC transporter permease [Ruminococcus sp.]